MQIDKVVLKTLITTTVYFLLLGALYVGIVLNNEHDDVNTNGTLICYTCIGV